VQRVHALSNNENRTPLSFETAELPMIECDIFRIFGNGNINGVISIIEFGVPDC
jgi:hypothetical protein